MGQATANIANDNGGLSTGQFDDRTGFKNFFENFKVDYEAETRAKNEALKAQLAQAQALLTQTQEPASKAHIKTALNLLKKMGMVIIAGIAVMSLWLLSKPFDPAQHLVAFSGLICAGLTVGYKAERKQNWRLKSLGVLIALISFYALIYCLGAYFSVSEFLPSNHMFWLTLSGFAFAASYALASRIALMISISMTAVWSYMQFSGFLPISEMSLFLPFIASGLTIRSGINKDKIGSMSSGLIAISWFIAANIFAFTSGLATAPFLLSIAILCIGIYYIASTHPLNVWKMNRWKTTSIIVWGAAITAVIASSWIWLYAALEISPPASPLNQFIWKLALIGGGGAILAAAFLRSSKHAHSLPRRLLGSISFIALAASHYFQKDIISFAETHEIEALPYFTAMVLMGVAATLTLSRFLSSIKYQHKAGLIISLCLITAIIASLSLLGSLETGGLLIFAMCAIVTIWILACTQTKDLSVQTVYRPMKKPVRQNQIKSDLPARPIRPIPMAGAIS